MAVDDRKSKAVAKSYDEIVRSTVPEPDSSFQPTPDQVRDGRHGARAQDGDERALEGLVSAAVSGIAISNLEVEVEHGRVVLFGQVASAEVLRQLEARLAEVPGVGSLDNRVVVAT